ncbi:UNVERIFIED_CONTAM: Vacuolar protein sorting-associated protein 51 [Sesamum calycinum]|uniref:Vacuolar protein sorting-associated protein 51 homolog n=1 Tax=Sesamum calycinum TaxID=2727403 RepID=A0AAW2SFE3_9LAMI
MEVEEGGVPLDEKARRMRDLLSSFYSPDHSASAASLPKHFIQIRHARYYQYHRIRRRSVQKSNVEGLLQKHVEMAAEIKNLDRPSNEYLCGNPFELQLITFPVSRMKNNIVGMETNMEQLLEKITSVQLRSDGVNTSLFERREHIEKLHRTRNLLRKVQFIYDLPTRLEKCIKSEAYAEAVKLYTGATPIFKAYGDSSFQDCKRASEEAVTIIIKKLQGKVFSDSESIQSRAEAVMLLKQLDFPVENLKVKLFEKLEQFLVDLNLESKELPRASVDASIREFAKAIRAYKVIFLHSEPQLSKLAQDLVKKHFEATHLRIMKQVYSGDLLAMLRLIWTDVLLMDEVLPEASLPDCALQYAHVAVRDYISSAFGRLLRYISDSLMTAQFTPKEGIEEEHSLQTALDAGKKAVTQGSTDALLDFRQLLDQETELLFRLRDLTIDWVQEGFRDFFKKLDGYFLLLSGKGNTTSEDVNLTEMPGDKIAAGLVLELASFSSGGGVPDYGHGSVLVPAEICPIFRSSGETFLHLYIKMRTQKISVLLKKRFTAPNWVKHKEPREVHMFVDMLLQEFKEIGTEVKQLLPQSLHHKHRRTNSNGSTASSRSSTLRDDKLSRSNIQKARSQLLESHLAKLFKQKMEIFTKLEHTQVIVSTAERCLDPIPLEPPVLDRLVQAKLPKTSEQNPVS